MYTYWPDPHNVTLIREKYIEVYLVIILIIKYTKVYFSC